MNNPWLKPIKVILPYFVVSVAWIALSDRAVMLLFPDPAIYLRLSTEKGIGFVVVTTALLYGLLVNDEKINRRTQLKLEGSRASFLSFFASNPSASWVYDRGTLKFLAVNPAALQQYGYTAEEFLSLTIMDIRPPEERERVIQFLKDSSFTSQDGNIWLHRRKNGEVFEVRLSSHQIEFGGRPAILAVVEDLSATKAAREALQAETARRMALEEIMNSGPAVTIQWTAQAGWPVEVVSRNIHLFGYEPDDFSSGRLTLEKIIHPDDLPIIHDLVQEWTSRQMHEFAREYRIYTGTGDIRWVEDRCLVDYDADGKAVRFKTMLWDVTDRKQDEEEKFEALKELENSEQRLKDIIGFLPDATFAIDLNHSVILWNHTIEETTGVRAIEIMGKGEYEYSFPFYGEPRPILVDYVLSPELPGFHDFYPNVRVDANVLEAEEELSHGKFSNIVRIKAAPLFDVQGNVIGAIETIQDITQQKQAELILKQDKEALAERVKERTAQLEEINQELEAFSYSVSHDLRAPLRHIDGFSRALFEDYENVLGEGGKHYLQRIRSGIENMSELIDALLKLSRITRTELSVEPVNLSTIASAVFAEHVVNEPDRQVQFQCADDLMIDGDPRLMRVVMENLLDNAWKFTARVNPASIELGRCPDRPEVYFIRDNGAGFDPSYASKLFGAFQRLHSTTEFPGTGIGLATVSRILHRHGGRIWAEGAVGKGATFYFTL